MDPTVHALLKDMNILELQAINSRKMRTLEEIKADLKAKGMTANSSSNVIPPVPSTPPPTCQGMLSTGVQLINKRREELLKPS